MAQIQAPFVLIYASRSHNTCPLTSVNIREKNQLGFLPTRNTSEALRVHMYQNFRQFRVQKKCSRSISQHFKSF